MKHKPERNSFPSSQGQHRQLPPTGQTCVYSMPCGLMGGDGTRSSSAITVIKISLGSTWHLSLEDLESFFLLCSYYFHFIPTKRKAKQEREVVICQGSLCKPEKQFFKDEKDFKICEIQFPFQPKMGQVHDSIRNMAFTELSVYQK